MPTAHKAWEELDGEQRRELESQYLKELSMMSMPGLTDEGVDVHVHRDVPPNDGGLANIVIVYRASINGGTMAELRERIPFDELTPILPREREEPTRACRCRSDWRGNPLHV